MFSVIKSGMDTAMKDLAVISNNISNANSTGFRKSTVSFSEFFNGKTSEGIDSALAGQGANSEKARLSDAQGALVEVGGALDAAIVGNGYFLIQGQNQEGYSVTRNGAFSVDDDGFLKSVNGSFLLGAVAVENEFVGVGEDPNTFQRIQIPFDQTDQPLTDISIGANGSISASFGADTNVAIATIPLSIFSNPNGFKQLGGGAYSPTQDSGRMFLGSPNSAGFGSLETGYVEGSNVDITSEMTNMIRAQQQFSGAAKILQTNSDMIEKMTR